MWTNSPTFGVTFNEYGNKGIIVKGSSLVHLHLDFIPV